MDNFELVTSDPTISEGFAELLGAFEKLLRHVCLSAWRNSSPTGYIFMKFDI